ncbi:Trimeric LpxA-like [Syntrophomonas zehnderi OL-4]|uniref:Trimeric LpxA-like n=1 Tax=Syntrophomonas zehnderi OL-4 TaxID=690567 RepID=A0A0E3W3T8_9FIRM|nr:gamma carbonic anhydrase family protein [Syntrophomonas zehnderi]CFY04634.1 Trimeric LpxA-like [Syntrophomonas zehnderi OL-4]
MPLYEYEGKRPQIDETSFIHPQAVIIGDVRIGQHCYVGAGTILRGDYGTIIIGNGSNIQENSVLHSEPETVADIGADVLIGHAAIVHGPCTLHNSVVIGMGAIVSTHCVLEEGSFLAAGSVLPPRRTIPAWQLAMGNPAKAIRETTEEMVQYNLISVKLYQDLAQRCKTGLKLID